MMIFNDRISDKLKILLQILYNLVDIFTIISFQTWPGRCSDLSNVDAVFLSVSLKISM